MWCELRRDIIETPHWAARKGRFSLKILFRFKNSGTQLLIPTLRRQRQEDCSEFQAKQGYLVRYCLKKETTIITRTII